MMNLPELKPAFRKRFAVHLDVRAYEKDGVHFARCDALSLSDQGESDTQAVDNLANTLMLYLETCRQHGTLFKILKKNKVAYEGAGELDEKLLDVPIPVLKWEQGNVIPAGN